MSRPHDPRPRSKTTYLDSLTLDYIASEGLKTCETLWNLYTICENALKGDFTTFFRKQLVNRRLLCTCYHRYFVKVSQIWVSKFSFLLLSRFDLSNYSSFGPGLMWSRHEKSCELAFFYFHNRVKVCSSTWDKSCSKNK